MWLVPLWDHLNRALVLPTLRARPLPRPRILLTPPPPNRQALPRSSLNSVSSHKRVNKSAGVPGAPPFCPAIRTCSCKSTKAPVFFTWCTDSLCITNSSRWWCFFSSFCASHGRSILYVLYLTSPRCSFLSSRELTRASTDTRGAQQRKENEVTPTRDTITTMRPIQTHKSSLH